MSEPDPDDLFVLTANALLPRTRPEFYDAWAADARMAGASEEGIAANIAHEIREVQALVEGRCPQCGQPVARYVDPMRQLGPSIKSGVWVMFRCSTQPPPGQPRNASGCDFLLDLKLDLTPEAP